MCRRACTFIILLQNTLSLLELNIKEEGVNPGGAGGNRTHEYRFCRPVPYHLATAPTNEFKSIGNITDHPRHASKIGEKSSAKNRGTSISDSLSGAPTSIRHQTTTDPVKEFEAQAGLQFPIVVIRFPLLHGRI